MLQTHTFKRVDGPSHIDLSNPYRTHSNSTMASSTNTMTTTTTTTSSSGGAAHLAGARYGKDKVRVLRVVRGDRDGPRWHDVVEYNVCALVEGEIETRCVCVLRSGCWERMGVLTMVNGESHLRWNWDGGMRAASRRRITRWWLRRIRVSALIYCFVMLGRG